MAKEILETAKKANLRIEVDQVDERLKKQIPIWYHPALKQGEKHDNNSQLSKHLRRKHGIISVNDTVKIAQLANHNARKEGGSCPCNTCSDLEIKAGCKLIEDCIRHAHKLIKRISDKWKPKLGLSITISTKKTTLPLLNGTSDSLTKEATIIKKRAKTSSINNIFRILRGKEKTLNENQTERTTPKIPHTAIEIAYTDGSCTHNGLSNATSGSGVHFPESPNKDLALKVPGSTHSNQIGEIYAITRAVQELDPNSNLIIITDSDYTIKSLSTRLSQAEDNGWTDIKIHPWIREALDTIKEKVGETAICWTKAHANKHGNQKADSLAKEGANKTSPDWVEYKAAGRVTGLKLSSITQSIAYRAILQERHIPELKKVSDNLDRIQSDMNLGIMKQSPPYDIIWKDLKQSKNIYRTQREFLFKSITNIH